MKTLFYDNRHLLWLTLGVALVGGTSALLTLPRLEDPRINNRNPVIVTRLPGASAGRVEALVTDKIEDKLREVAEVKHIESDSRAGVSFVRVELNDDVYDSDTVFSRLRDKLADADLPAGASLPFFDDERGPVAYTYIIGVSGGVPAGVLRRTADELADRLRTLGGTDLVRLFGEPDEEVVVTIDPDALARLGLTAGEVAAKIREADSKVAAGVHRPAGGRLVVEVAGQLRAVDRLRRIPLARDADGHVTRLGDVAVVERGQLDPPRAVGMTGTTPTVFVAARMEPDRRVDDWMSQARGVVGAMRGEMSAEVKLDEVFDQSVYTRGRLGDLSANLFTGAGVIVLVILLMMGWRSSLLVGAALPLVAAAVLFTFSAIGVPIHQMSIFGLIVALGLLIDNAIVVADEMRSRARAGLSPREAVAATVGHLAVPLFGSTLTTVVAFLPIFLLPGNVGEFVGTIAVSVILAVSFSFAAAMTVIPALTAIFGGPAAGRGWWREGVSSAWLAGAYRRVLTFFVSRPRVGILAACAVPLVGFLRAGDLRDQFFPGADRDQFFVHVWMPRDSSLAHTRETAERMTAVICRFAGVEEIHWTVGRSFPSVYYNMMMTREDTPSYAQAVIRAASPARVKTLSGELQAALDREFPEAQCAVKIFGQGPPFEAPVEIRLFGPSLKTLRELADEVKAALYKTPEVVQVRSTLEGGEPKLWAETDEEAAALGGLSLRDVAGQLDSLLEGQTGGSVLERTEEMPVRVRVGGEARADAAELAGARLRLPAGGWAPLSAYGGLALRPDAANIPRRDGEPCNTVQAFTTAGALPPEVTAAAMARLERDGFRLPAGYRLELGGDAQEKGEAMADLFRFAPVLGVVMLATVVLSFRSFASAAVLGVVAACSAGIAFFTLWVGGYPLGFNPLIGTAGLIGIALNDSIVVLAALRANPLARAGDGAAVVEEVIGATRHVLSTTLTTIGGFVPLLIAGGDFWPPLAAVIAGGVGGATVLALVFVPCAFRLLARKGERAIS